ncbi:MAG: FkbM family methyltransferase [Kiloniellaceae bacterium]
MTKSAAKILLPLLEFVIARSRGYLAIELFTRLCKKLNVKGIAVDGDYGRIYGDPRDEIILRHYIEHGYWAREIVGFINESFSGPGGVFLDIGANIGLVTLPVSANKNVICKAIEPDPANFELLSQNVRANSSDANIHLYNLALFDRDGHLDFELSPDNLGDHRVRANGARAPSGEFGEHQREVIRVKAVTLDALTDLRDLRGKLVAKMDTQGAEAHVFKGGAKVLSHADVIIFEFWPYGLARLGADLDFLYEFLGKNFRFGSIVEAGNTIARDDFRDIDAIIDRLRGHAAGGDKDWHCDAIVCKDLPGRSSAD